MCLKSKQTDGAKSFDKKSICNAFNKSFAEMSKYSGDFVPLNIHKLDHCSKKFNFRVLTSKEIYKTIDSLENSKSPGPGLSHAWALKVVKYAVGTHLQFIFNEFIQNCVFPTILKHAFVTPILKKGSTRQVCNNRPISVAPNFSKLFEKLLIFQMLDHINKNTLLNKEQFGFQNKKSSTDAVLFFTHSNRKPLKWDKHCSNFLRPCKSIQFNFAQKNS